LQENAHLRIMLKGLSTFKPTGWLLTILIATAWILPFLFSRGMFYDGLIYSTISRNLAEGAGTLWKPFFTATHDKEFYGHLPLVFGIQSLFFRLLGDHYWTEKIYSAVCFIAAGALTVAIWRTWASKFYWLPVLFWLSCQAVKWSYANNFNDNTMAVFCLLSGLVSIRSLQTGRHHYTGAIAAGIITAVAILCKTPLGMFTFAIPGLYWLVFRNVSFGKAVLMTLLSCLTLAVIFFGLWQIPDARNNFTQFIRIQLFPSMSGSIEWIRDSRFYILGHLILQLGPSILACLLLYFSFRKWVLADNDRLRQTLFYNLVGLAGSLPIMISLKQMDVYLVLSLPFFALAAATFAQPYLQGLMEINVKPVLIKALNVLLILITAGLIGWSISRAGKPGRNEQLITTLDEIGPYLPKNAVVAMPNDWHVGWNLRAYLYRFHYVSVDISGTLHPYYLVAEEKAYHPADYVLVAQSKAGYYLYHKPN
jgi:4-amino-4-deoxy-L-arabinose transferase-like glycosyltransferase